MMHRSRTWSVDSTKTVLRTERNRILPIRGGDGSTLSLDFTTGVLDTRLTFTRGTNATFINSSGLVQYADANYVQNSNDMSASGWTIQNDATRSFDATVVNPLGGLGASVATASSVFGSSAVNSSSFTVNGGLKYTISFWVRAGTATQLLVGVYDPTPPAAFTPATAAVMSGAGSAIGSSSIVVSGLTSSWTRVRIHLSPTYSGPRAISFYPDAALASGKTLYLWGVKWEAGHVSDPVQITTGASAYYAPRFDYDPISIGALRGLLIEATSSNLLTYSESFRKTAVGSEQVWADSASISRGLETGPDGVSNSSVNFVAIGVPGTVIASSAVGTAAVRTLSFWAKRTGGGTVEYTVDNGASWNSQAITETWTRYSFVLTSANHHVGFRIAAGTGTAIYGVQLEAGSGASSYIPTGASTGNRTGDSLVIQDGAWRNTAIDSTWYVDGVLNKMTTAFNPVFLFVGNAGYTEQNRVFISATGSQVRFTHYARSASVNPDFEYAINQASPNGYVYGSRFKVAATFDNTAGENRSSWNGATSNGTTAAACTTSPTYFTITIGNGNDWHFRSIKYWPLSLPQTTLNGITTL